MPRLFTGLELPDALKQSLSLYRGGLFGARWADPADYHLTLRFIGDIDERTGHDIADHLAMLRPKPIAISFTHLDVFGGNRPHSLILAVRQTPDLMKLQADHERLLRRLGLEPEPRKFTPHITIARLGREAGVRQIADYLSIRGGPMPQGFVADEFVLFSAREGGGGPYLVEDAYPMQMNAAMMAG